MALIKKKDSRPEVAVRRLLHALGYRFRLHVAGLPGTPDIVLPGRGKIVMVHGCFWHRHDCRDGQKLPRSKPDYWGPKLARNAERDRRHLQELALQGWDVVVVWECELGDVEGLASTLKEFLDHPNARQRTSRPMRRRSPREPQAR
ncbi:MAG: DNA mismatch endonuclease Vsr [Hyphomicrobiaceae bacterium]|nr:MAG: DNA mismatch endonuclease Vsr [Hyphomicrobiaceae bacterium]